MNLKLYPFGYILSDKKLDSLPPNYVNQEVIDEYYYYIDSGTKYSLSKNEESFLIIHGDYIHIGIYNNIPYNLIAKTLFSLYLNNYEEFLNTLDYLAGRFTIIIKDNDEVKIFPDATNSRSNYYSTDRILVSSHVQLLADIYKYSRSKGVSTQKRIFLNTPFDNIKSTLPNHFVELKSNKITRFFPRRNNPFTQINVEKRFQLVEKFWKTQMDTYHDYYKDMIFSITGGLDSRFSLALSKKHINHLKFFTYSLRDKIDSSTAKSKMLSKDYAIVKNILEDIPLIHKFIFFDDNPISLTNEETEIVRKNTISIHLPKLNKYIYDVYGDNLLHIRGNLMEIGQAYLHKRKKVPSTKEEAKAAILNVYKNETKDHDTLNKLYNEFSTTINYLSDTYDYHLVDLVYWELRMGRWICEVSNNHDPIFKTINPFNHRALISISLSFPYNQRRDCYMFKEIINRNFPILNFYGVNDYNNIYEQTKKDYSTVTKSVNEHYNKKFFNEFLVDFNTVKTVSKCNQQNKLFIPKTLNKEGSYVESSVTFERENGIAYLIIKSPYSSKKYKEFIFYEIYKNNRLLLKEDISNWTNPNHISIPGLQKNDSIKIRLRINKDLPQMENWESNSQLILLDYVQVSSKMSDRNLINHSSPYSIKATS